MRNFLVTTCPEIEMPYFLKETFIVKAKAKGEAVNIFCEYYVLKDKSFRDNIYERTVNMSFAEKFWIQTKEEERRFNDNGEIIVTKENFIERVKEYFGEKKEWAEIYIDYFFNYKIKRKDNPFSDEMIKFMWYKQENWCSIAIIDLGLIKEIN